MVAWCNGLAWIRADLVRVLVLQLVAWCHGLAWIRACLVRMLVLQLVAWCNGLAWIRAGLVSCNWLHGATDWHGSGLAW